MKKSLFAIAVAAMALMSCSGPKWVSLFNGKDLTGWHQGAGAAEYKVQDKCITGFIQTEKPGNSFLVTDEEYSDFILEFDFKMEGGNSGVQFRSWTTESGKVTGYQYEFDNSARRFTGGVYWEGQNWLYPLTFNDSARDVYKPGEWNKGRIEAYGTSIRTFVNGVECSNLIADVKDKGFFGLQVHATKDKELEGKTVQWKKIRICTEDVEKYLTPENKDIHQVNWIANTLSERQQAEGWKLLFNGKDSEGWRSAKGETFPEEGWTIADGMLQVWENGGAESTHGGDIITVDQYENFWLSVDFKMTKGANSGIKYFVRPDLYNVVEASAIGCEFQILDDKNHPDANLGTAQNRTLGSLYDLIKSDKDGAYLRPGQWNTAWVKVNGNHVEHWLNGHKIVEYDRNTQMFNMLVSESKYQNWENFGNHKKGHILLQEHGNQVFFRNVIIKELPATEPVKAVKATLSEEEMNNGWTSLFDGKSLAGWVSAKDSTKTPEQGWLAEDGVLTVNPEPGKRGGDIMTAKAYKDFMFSMEFKLTEGANSGLKYFINPGAYKEPTIGCEFQVLDDDLHPDAKLGTNGNRTVGSLYDVITADKSEVDFHKYDWNNAVLIVKGNHVEHWLNGVKVVEYERNTQIFNALVQHSKFAGREGFGCFETGHILLQDHQDKVFYRNIRIKEL